MLIFDVIETGEPSLAGRFWTSGTDWAVVAETTEDQPSRTLIGMIEFSGKLVTCIGGDKKFIAFACSIRMNSWRC